ncbi:MAG: DNA alkylation response protein [Actinobacteria bacterium 13_2_20CM_2_71_6]|nr:MAG: DNA alkylation response protein [Actinobacteria bacterium 13_2_20CM_2_71_6]
MPSSLLRCFDLGNRISQSSSNGHYDRRVTHEVTNQVPPLVGYDPPVLRTHDRYGHRIDEVDFHPAWHELLDVAVGAGLAGACWADPRPGSHVARAAGLVVWGAVEQGHTCPVSMTYAAVPALRTTPDLAKVYEPLLTSRAYDVGLRVPAGKRGLLAGMGMTEKQGGSDVRTNSTTATASPDGTWRLRGHKWFTSAPMSDLFLVLAQAPGGLSCFLVPRVLPDGTRNPFRIQRLKDKLGNRSNASAEPEFDDTVGWLVGAEGRGVATIIEMVAMTRLDCGLGSAAIMRTALVQAAHHARYRMAFGSRLVEKPLMRNVLADLALESEAALSLALRVAGAVDRAARGDETEHAFKRLATPLAKYWICKRLPATVAEALECLGGNGYVEDSGMPRLYREAPLNGIWEGSGNVTALDVLRALTREPDSFTAYQTEIEPALGADRHLDAAWTRLRRDLGDGAEPELRARGLAERMALVLQGSLLVRYAPNPVADAFCATRLGGDHGLAFGTLPAGLDLAAILDRIPQHVTG